MLLLVDFPKPVHGMSTINFQFHQHLTNKDVPCHVINTVPSYASHFFGSRIWSIIKVFHSLFCLIRLLSFLCTHSNSTVYRSINGGNGQIYDWFYFIICRAFKCNLYIHHHSFHYLNKKKWIFQVSNTLSGCQAIHIVLSNNMGELLSDIYSIDSDKIRIQSNLAFFPVIQNYQPKSENRKLVIGHLANLTPSKGLDIFIDICKRLEKKKIQFEAYIAGPASDENAQLLLDQTVSQFANIHYIGPVYHDKKSDFYSQLDCFIFPTKYSNEAEPLVLYEAAQYGAFIIGTERGCMKPVIHDLGGFSLPEQKGLSELVTDQLISLHNNGEFSSLNVLNRISVFQQLQQSAIQDLNNLSSELESLHVSAAGQI